MKNDLSKKMILTLIFSFSSSIFAADLNAEHDACEKIECSDLKGKEQFLCQKSRGECHQKVLKKQLIIWKDQGIDPKERGEVLKSIKSAQKKNEEVLKGIEEEVVNLKKMLQELKSLQKEVSSLKPAK